MDWNDYVDSYCERVAPGLAGEPLNALTNAAFLIAAFAVWRGLRTPARTGRTPASLTALVVLLVLIGLGSLAFHTYATRWSAALDVLFIALFTHFYAACYPHWFFGVRWRWAWLGAVAFFLLTLLINLVADDALPAGSSSYLPALIGLAVLTVALGLTSDHALRRYRVWFGVAGAVFTVSLFLRTVDADVCARFSAGTHFLWHLLNAFVLFLVAHAAVIRWRELSRA